MTDHLNTGGVVSVFLGIVPDRKIFDDYLRETYAEDDDNPSATCPLWDDLGVTWLDHDFQDAHYEGNAPVPTDVFLANQFSYIDSFRAGVVEACSRLGIAKVNAGILLYNHAYLADRDFPPLRTFVSSVIFHTPLRSINGS